MLTLITITGDRCVSFSLCEKYMSRQTVKWDRWVVIDDGNVPTIPTLDQSVMRFPAGIVPQESFRRNMQTALASIGNMHRSDKVLIIEDDDWYSRWHIEGLSAKLESSSLAGESRAKYYHVAQRKFSVHSNTQHASLCQTGFRGNDVRNLILTYLQSNPYPERLDGHIWRRAGIVDSIKSLGPTSTTTVGIKGGPGRGGLGIDHGELDGRYKPDPDASLLKTWLAEDAEPYLQHFDPEFYAGTKHAHH